MSLRCIDVGPAVLLAALTLAATPARAHCGDEPSAPLPYSIWPISEVVAADGVLGFEFFFNQAEAGLEYFTLKVLDGRERDAGVVRARGAA